MSSKIEIRGGFSSVSFPALRESTKKHGIRLCEAHHVFNVAEIRENGKAWFEGKCVREANVSISPYQLHLDLDENRNVTLARCNCVAGGDGLCKHIGALISFINAERIESVTDEASNWYKPPEKGKLLYPKGKRIANIFPKIMAAKEATFQVSLEIPVLRQSQQSSILS